MDTAVAVAEQLASSPGAAVTKAVTRPLVLPVLRAQQAVELEALATAAATPAVQEVLRAAHA
jgi:hypothetical protein